MRGTEEKKQKSRGSREGSRDVQGVSEKEKKNGKAKRKKAERENEEEEEEGSHERGVVVSCQRGGPSSGARARCLAQRTPFC